MADENISENSNSAPDSGNNNGAMSPMVIGVIVLGAILVVGALFFFMGRGAKTTEPAMVEETGDSQGTMESTNESTTVDGDVVEVQMEAGSFYFKPNVINAKLGQTVRVTLNSVSMQHDFVIDELGVKSSILPSGKSETFEFTASEVGTFEFYCAVANHRQMGMVGTLNVTQ